MNTEPQDPNPSDDRLMDALLREHVRLGSRNDETLLADLQNAIARETAVIPFPPRKTRWIWMAAAAAAAIAVAIPALLETQQLRPPSKPKSVAMGPVVPEAPQVEVIDEIYPIPSATPPPAVISAITTSSIISATTSPKPEAPAKAPDELLAQSIPVETRTSWAAQSGNGLAARGLPGTIGGAGGSARGLPGTMLGRAGGSAHAVPRKQNKAKDRSEAFTTGSERYGQLVDNPWRSPVDEALSTFSVDVDTASYANFRRLVNAGAHLPADALRLEEMVNYFDYDYPQPESDQPFSVGLDAAVTPWNPETRLVRVALHGREVPRLQRPPANLVFLVDVSGSMQSPDKLPLVIESFGILLEELNAKDTLSIVVYAGAEGVALPPTTCDAAGIKRVSAALSQLSAGGSTNGGAGITLAYKLARQNFKEGGINRVILATDGDFNVGVTHDGGLVSLVEKEAKSKVFLTVLGFGTGNLNDGMLEAITNKGNGTYHYIDSLIEARRVLLQKMMATLMTIAKDVKIQVEFNPAQVAEYRLLGYANRMLNKEDFNNDHVDAGDIGAGHTVTALYEIRPGRAKAVVDPLKYASKPTPTPETADSKEWLTVKLRYKQPEGDTSKLLSQPFAPERIPSLSDAPADFRFATAVAMTASHFRNTKDLGSLKAARDLAAGAKGNDPHGLRSEFVALLEKLMASQN